MTHNEIIPFIVEKLKKYPDIKFELKNDSDLIINPRTDKGFGLQVSTNERENTLFFGGTCHWHFDNSEKEQTEMLDQIVFGLTGIARIKVHTKNNKEYKWILELQDQNGNWSKGGTTGIINLNFWTKPEFHYLRNDLLPIENLYSNINNAEINIRQKLILFLISCNPGIRDIYNMVKIYDRADFPSEVDKNLKPLLDNGLIFVSKNFDNGTPSIYEITEKGKIYLDQNINEKEIINYVTNMQSPALLLQITQKYFDRKNGL
jgi:DNA-binding MarR family transcriptional regulator